MAVVTYGKREITLLPNSRYEYVLLFDQEDYSSTAIGKKSKRSEILQVLILLENHEFTTVRKNAVLQCLHWQLLETSANAIC